MKHVVNFSGGLCSFWAAYRVVQKYGIENVVLLFADTLVEHPDLYAFLAWAARILGVPITRIADGRTPWQLFRDRNMIGNNLKPICSDVLKREMLDAWHEAHCLNIGEEGQEQIPFIHDGRMPATVYVGFDWTEPNRLADLRKQKPLWRIEAPMVDEPIWNKCRMEQEARRLGMPEQRLYSLGFPHNNCGGRCVRAGISHWVHLYRTMPDRFLEWMEEEQATILHFQAKGISTEWATILKDRRGGVSRGMTLLTLKGRVDAGEKFPTDEWGGCGCGGAKAA